MARRGPASMCVAGDYLFTVGATTAVVSIHDLGTGALLGELKPGTEVGSRSGWVDIPYGINAVRRSDGEYVVLVEEDERAKNILYRFTPPKGVVAASQKLIAQAAGGRVNLRWETVPNAGSYLVARSPAEAGPYETLGQAGDGCIFVDRAVQAGTRYYYQVTAVGWSGAGKPSAAVSTTPAVSSATVEEDFEGGQSVLPGIKVLPMPKPPLASGGARVGEMPAIAWLSGFDLPAGAKKVTIEYDRLFLKSPEGQCRTHYTRQYVTFDTTGDQRWAQEERSAVNAQDAGKWTHVRVEITVPEGARRVKGGEVNCIAENAKPGYDNPVYIDNFRVTAEVPR